MMTFDISRAFFWLVAASLLVSGSVVVSSRRPVLSVVALISCFVMGSILWLMVGAEFLSLGLIFVYVGAVMTLFLFVVMMLNQEKVEVISRRMIVWPVAAILFALMSYMIIHSFMGSSIWLATPTGKISVHTPNVEAIGHVLYTQFVLSFEIAAVILLVAMLGAITLTFRGVKPGTKRQRIADQVKIRKADRFELIDLKKE